MSPPGVSVNVMNTQFTIMVRMTKKPNALKLVKENFVIIITNLNITQEIKGMGWTTRH